jgi:hypothetical protein
MIYTKTNTHPETPGATVCFRAHREALLISAIPIIPELKKAINHCKDKMQHDYIISQSKIVKEIGKINHEKNKDLTNIASIANVDKVRVQNEIKNNYKDKRESLDKELSLLKNELNTNINELNALYANVIKNWQELNDDTSYLSNRYLSRYQKTISWFDNPSLNMHLKILSYNDKEEFLKLTQNYKKESRQKIEEMNRIAYYPLLAEKIGLTLYQLGNCLSVVALFTVAVPAVFVLALILMIVCIPPLFFIISYNAGMYGKGPFDGFDSIALTGAPVAAYLSIASILSYALSAIVLAMPTFYFDNTKVFSDQEVELRWRENSGTNDKCPLLKKASNYFSFFKNKKNKSTEKVAETEIEKEGESIPPTIHKC